MLLVSSLDVFDCCGLELGGECPTWIPVGERTGRDVLAWFCGPSREARALSPAQEHARPGARASVAVCWECGQTQPDPEPLDSQSSGHKDDRSGDKDAGSDPEFVGSLRTWLCAGAPFHVPHGHLTPRGAAWKIQEPGQPSPTVTCFRVAQEATGRCPGGRRVDEVVARWQLLLLGPTRLLFPPPFSPHFLGCSLGVVSPWKPLVLPPRPRRAGCVCVSGSLSSDPIPLPRHRDAGQDPRALHGGREREKVFYIRYLFNIPF